MPKMRPLCQVVLKAVRVHRIPALLSKHIILPFFETLLIDFHFVINTLTNFDRLEKL